MSPGAPGGTPPGTPAFSKSAKPSSLKSRSKPRLSPNRVVAGGPRSTVLVCVLSLNTSLCSTFSQETFSYQFKNSLASASLLSDDYHDHEPRFKGDFDMKH